MGRFIIDDCRSLIPNRFDLVIIASQRARDVSAGLKPKIEPFSKDKSIIISLRELAENRLDLSDIKRLVIRRHKLNISEFGYVPELNDEDQPEEAIEEVQDHQSKLNPIKDNNDGLFFGDDNI